MNAIISQYRLAIMGISMIFVILFHQGFVSGIIPSFFHKIGYLGVDAFLFISGFGIYFSLNNSKRISKNTIVDFYKRRILRMMPTCIIAGIVFLYFWMVSHPSLYRIGSPNFCNAFIGLDVWYIRTIMIYYLLAPFLYRFIKSSKLALFIFIMLSIATPFLSWCGNIFVAKLFGTSFFMQQTITWTIARLPAFVFGILFAQMNYSKKCLLNWKFIVIALLCAFLLVASPYIYKLNLFQTHSYYSFLRIITSHTVMILPALPLLFLLAIVIIKKMGKQAQKSLEWIGNYSLEIFLAHSAIFPYAKTIFGQGWIVFAGALISSVLASVALKYLAKLAATIFIIRKA